jgi:nucleoside 2-deoxyribosyltransferase
MAHPYSIYFAGELFSLKHLVGNALLVEALEKLSDNRYRCVVPQDLEVRDATSLYIRNHDLYFCMSSDLGIFHFDGPELDSGTAAEFLFAKMLDIPAVILRTDFRQAGDARSVPWNLMLSGFPRTELVLIDSVALYKQGTEERGMTGPQAAQFATEELAKLVIAALDTARQSPPVLPPEHRERVYEWARLFPGSGFDVRVPHAKALELLQSKLDRGLL